MVFHLLVYYLLRSFKHLLSVCILFYLALLSIFMFTHCQSDSQSPTDLESTQSDSQSPTDLESTQSQNIGNARTKCLYVHGMPIHK